MTYFLNTSTPISTTIDSKILITHMILKEKTPNDLFIWYAPKRKTCIATI